jgi:hypothetical protein
VHHRLPPCYLEDNLYLDEDAFLWGLAGLLPPGTQFDLFRGTAAMKQDVDDMYPTNLSHTIKVCLLYLSRHYFVTF